MSRILPLSEDAAAQIQSSKTIATLQGVVLALLENSLDAEATKVEISIDFPRGGCTIEDNGSGILSSEFSPTGGLGRMYHTSKRSGSLLFKEVHGTAGACVASLAALCLLSITSKHRDSLDNSTLVMHSGKVISRHVPSLIQDELNTTSGTRVVVRDLFGNMPVRVKQRALANDVSVKDERQWHELKKGITALLLAWHSPCTVRVKGLHDGTPVVLSSGFSACGGMLTEASLNRLDGRARKYDMRDRLPLLSHAGLMPVESRHRFDPVAASTLEISIKGFFCLDPAPTRQCQFISLGIHPLAAMDGHAELYEVVNQIFANSSYGAIDEPEANEVENERRKRDRRFKNDGYTQKQLHGRKGVDRWPSFVLNFRIEGHAIRNTHHVVSDRYLRAMVDLLKATATRWLDAHHFRPRKLRHKRGDNQSGPAGLSSSPRRSSTADGLSRQPHDSLTTPSIKRASTMESATTSKRLRTNACPEVPSMLSQFNGSLQSSGDYFNNLSRIKSGRPASTETGRKTNLSATPKHSTVTAETPRHPFALPTLGKGALSSIHAETPRPAPSTPKPEDTGPKHDSSRGMVDSDDYGSIDESAVLESYNEVEYPTSVLPTDAVIEPGTHPHDAIVEWHDPSTKQVYRVNTRTGVVLPAAAAAMSGQQDAEAYRSKAAIDTTRTTAGNALSLALRPKSAVHTPGEQWLPGFLQQWSNPVFTRQADERIPVAAFDGPGVDFSGVKNHRSTDHALSQLFAQSASKLGSKLSKKVLASVKVIKQVDAKFILCVMPSTDEGEDKKTLVLVDQHAASERVVLEGLFAQLCRAMGPGSPAAAYVSTLGCKSAVSTVLLEKPLLFQVSAKEHELFRQQADRFAEWGILYDLKIKPGKTDADHLRAQKSQQHLLTVTALPPGIAERCVLFPHLLIELLRSEVWEDSTLTRCSFSAHEDAGENTWLRRIGSCPKGIIDMLNSRACRSAIMFNDILSIEDCERLLRDLSTCSFPFMCAHGRVSMVPLVEVNNGGGVDAGVEGFSCNSSTLRDAPDDGNGVFTTAFSQWRGRSTCISRNKAG